MIRYDIVQKAYESCIPRQHGKPYRRNMFQYLQYYARYHDLTYEEYYRVLFLLRRFNEKYGIDKEIEANLKDLKIML